MSNNSLQAVYTGPNGNIEGFLYGIQPETCVTVGKNDINSQFNTAKYANDSLCLQAAIDFASNNGKRSVFIKSGIYVLPVTVTIPSRLTIFGVGRATEITGTAATLFSIENLPTARVNIRDIFLNHDLTTPGTIGLRIYRASYVFLDRVITSKAERGFYIEDSGQVYFDKCHALFYTGTGFHMFGSGTSGLPGIFCDIRDSLASDGGTGYHIEGVIDYINLDHPCAVKNTVGGLKILDTTGGYVHIDKPNFQNPTALFEFNFDTIERVKVVGGLLAGDADVNVLATNCNKVELIALEVNSSNKENIVFDSCFRCSVIGCKVLSASKLFSNVHSSIKITGGGEHIITSSEIFSLGGPYAKDGVEVIGSSNNKINDNLIKNHGHHGVSLSGSTRNTINDNTFQNNSQETNNTYNDIYLSGTSVRNNISDNNCFAGGTNKVKYHIEEAAGADTSNIITNNNLSGAVTDLIQKRGATSTVFNNFNYNPQIQQNLGNVTGALTVAPTLGNAAVMTLTGNVTLTLNPGKVANDRFCFTFIQDATGSRTLTLPSNIKVAGGSFVLSTGATAVDTLSLIWDGTNWKETSRAINLS